MFDIIFRARNQLVDEESIEWAAERQRGTMVVYGVDLLLDFVAFSF